MARGLTLGQLLTAGFAGLAFTIVALFLIPGSASAATLSRPPNNLDLVGYWPMDEGRGTQVGDMSGNGNHGSLSGDPQWTSGTRAGAMDFDGDDWVQAGPSPNINISSYPFTLTAWAYVSNNSIHTIQSLVVDGYNGTYFTTHIDADIPNCTARKDAGATDTISGQELENGWHHIICVFASSTDRKLYVDGSEVGSSTLAQDFDTDVNTLLIGLRRNSFNTAYFEGKIDDARLYRRALLPTEISDLYNSGAVKMGVTPKGPTAGLIGHWTFDGKDMTPKVQDISGNGNHGALVGQTATTTTLGKIGQALSFDGADDRVSLDAHAANFDFEADYTVSFWVNPSQSLSFDTPFAANIDGNTGSAGQKYEIFFASSISFLLRVGDGTNNDQENFAVSSMTVGEWAFMTLTIDADKNVKAYKNASALSLNSGNGVVDVDSSLITTGSVSIGSTGTGRFFPGKIDDVRVYNRALTADEVYRLYTMGR
ncbi:MAG: LamG domain-containing protein [Candidatus Paceibacterota bacterium]